MDGESIQSGATTGLMSAPSLVENPKGVRINTVENGFTVALEGGKQKQGEPYRHHRLHVAKDEDEALQIAKDFLAKD